MKTTVKSQMAFNKLGKVYTKSGIQIAPIKAEQAKAILDSSNPRLKDTIAGLTRFWNISEKDAAAIVPKHPKFGWYGYPVISKENANDQWLHFEEVAMNQMFVKTAKQSLHSACLSIDINFNSNIDYIYIKMDFQEKTEKSL